MIFTKINRHDHETNHPDKLAPWGKMKAVTYRHGPTHGAIETRYRGCRFRSRLEARFAVLFDHLDLEWQFEPEGFHTAAGPYLPDFYLPELRQWIEIKGGQPNKSDLEKMKAFARDQWFEDPRKWFLILFQGIQEHGPLIGVGWGQRDDGSHGLIVERFTAIVSEARMQRALTAARSARFEHGESG